MDMSHLCVLLTGAGESVGRVAAEKFQAAGAAVHICDIRPDAVEATLGDNPEMSGSVCNVGDSTLWRVEWHDGDLIGVNPLAEWCDESEYYKLETTQED